MIANSVSAQFFVKNCADALGRNSARQTIVNALLQQSLEEREGRGRTRYLTSYTNP